MRFPTLHNISLICLSLSAVVRAQSQQNYTAAEQAAKQLNTCYDRSIGLWRCNTGWWNSANALTALIDLALVDGNVVGDVTQQLADTYQNAQKQNDNFNTISRRTPALPRRHAYTSIVLQQRATENEFLNSFYDDEGWWALAWIGAYDLTKETTYLDAAANIYLDMTQGWPTRCGNGGIWWDKPHTQVNAIANELFIAVGAALAIRDTNSAQAWTTWAKQGWEWFQQTGLINTQNLINDHLDNCQNTGKEIVWSYNQGVILGGLADLSTVTGDPSYMDHAQKLATASMSYLADDKTHIVGEPGCNDDECNLTSDQFKGAYIRNLFKLYKAVQSNDMKQSIKQVLIASGNGAWYSNGPPADAGSLKLHTDWATGWGDLNVATQSAALEAIVGMLWAYR